MELNAFQMMNQTHEHERHLLKQQLNRQTHKTTTIEQDTMRKLKEDKNKIFNRLDQQLNTFEPIELNKNTNYRIEMKNKHN